MTHPSLTTNQDLQTSTVMLVQLLAAVLVLSSPVWSGPTRDASSARLQLDSELEAWLQENGEKLQEIANSQPSQHPSPRRKNYGTYEYIRDHGYPAEKHAVHTDDGYILTVFRLANPGKPAVFVQHGLLASSADFVVLGPNKGLAYVLFDAGFDVWLGNNRGTTESRKHERLNTGLSQFWDFSWHEIGIHDLPAAIDYVLHQTNQTALHYVGHSQGTTTFFVLGAERPEYMPKIKTFTALAPIAYLRDSRSVPFRLMAEYSEELKTLLNLVGVDEFLPKNDLITQLGGLVCGDGSIVQPVCSNFLFLLVGTDTQQMNASMIPEMLENLPAGASTKQMLHYGQLIDTDELIFRQYDHGSKRNKKLYGSRYPPDYDLSTLTAETYLVYSDNDLLSPPSNIELLRKALPNIAEGGMRKVALSAFNHLDYLFAVNAKGLVYDDVVKSYHAYETAHSP